MTLPPTLEICARPFNNGVCGGIIYRPQPETSICARCGGSEAGVVYRRVDLPPSASVGTSNDMTLNATTFKVTD